VENFLKKMRNRRFFIFKSFPQKIAEFNVSQKKDLLLAEKPYFKLN